MNERFLCLFALLSVALPLRAEDAKIPPLPPGPLLNRAPDFSTWTVTSQGRPVEDKQPVKTAATGEVRTGDKEHVTMVSTVIKTGSTILEQNVDADGQKRQFWHFSHFRITSGSAKPLISPDYGGGDILSVNFASSDFAGFDWLSPKAYTGIMKYQGNDCIVFTGSVSPLSVREQTEERALIAQSRAVGVPVGNVLRVPAVAYIDLATRLPVFAQFGQEKRVYRYGAPPTAPLVLPPELADVVKGYAQRIEKLSAPASRAY